MGDGAAAFMPSQDQSAYAFPAGQPGEQDEAAESALRNQQIQAAFDAQRSSRASNQNTAKALASQSAEIARLRQRQAQQQRT
jgi:hypothetical protein